MSESEYRTDRNSIRAIHREFNGTEFGWNGITWLIELENKVQVNVGANPVMVDYFVASSLIDDAKETERTIIFPVNDMYRPLKHKGVVGNNGWNLRKAMTAFREWLDQRPDVRAIQEVTV